MKRKLLGLMAVPLLAVCLTLANCSSNTSTTPGPTTAYAVLRLTPASGGVDTTFAGGRGIAITDIDVALFDFALAVAIQPADNFILAGGSSGLSGQGVIALVRYDPNGVLDPAFGTGGIVRTPTPAGWGSASATAIAVQPDKKIVVAALTFNSSTSTTGITVLRYNTDGSLDTGFAAPKGFVSQTIGPGLAGDTCALALQGTNIIVAGASSNGNIVLYRYNSTGALDTTFGTSGVASINLGSPAMSPAIAIQPADNKIVVAGGKGSFDTTNPKPVDEVVLRFTADGALDTTTFGAAGPTPGIVTTDINLLGNYGNAVAIQALDGKIVVAGHANVNFQIDASDISLVRYNADGSLDTAFNAAGTKPGVVTTDLGGFDNALSVALQADTKIVVSGNTGAGGFTQTAVLRYNPDGSPDTTFGPTAKGNVVVQLAGPSNVASGNAVVLQPDGKIVVAGYD